MSKRNPSARRVPGVFLVYLVSLSLLCPSGARGGPLGTPIRDSLGKAVSREERDLLLRKDERYKAYKLACAVAVEGSRMECATVKQLIHREQRCIGMRIAWDTCYRRYVKFADHDAPIEEHLRSLLDWVRHGRLEKVCGPNGIPAGSERPAQFQYPGGC